MYLATPSSCKITSARRFDDRISMLFNAFGTPTFFSDLSFSRRTDRPSQGTTPDNNLPDTPNVSAPPSSSSSHYPSTPPPPLPARSRCARMRMRMRAESLNRAGPRGSVRDPAPRVAKRPPCGARCLMSIEGTGCASGSAQRNHGAGGMPGACAVRRLAVGRVGAGRRGQGGGCLGGGTAGSLLFFPAA